MTPKKLRGMWSVLVKGHARRAGLDSKLFAGHSLRSGFLLLRAASSLLVSQAHPVA
jgi:hypothetical protein